MAARKPTPRPGRHWAAARGRCPHPRKPPVIRGHLREQGREPKPWVYRHFDPLSSARMVLHTREVAGSSPAAPMAKAPLRRGFCLLTPVRSGAGSGDLEAFWKRQCWRVPPERRHPSSCSRRNQSLHPGPSCSNGMIRADVSLCSAVTEMPRCRAAAFAVSHSSEGCETASSRRAKRGASRSASDSSASSSSDAGTARASSEISLSPGESFHEDLLRG
jgi:hypothetical protein